MKKRRSRSPVTKRKDGALYLNGRKLKEESYIVQFNCQEGWSITLEDQSKYRLRGAAL